MPPVAIAAAAGAALIGGGIAGAAASRRKSEKEARESQSYSDVKRAESLERQKGLYEGMMAPENTPQMKARLAALEQESQKVPLSQNPEFQGYRSQLLGSGARELAGIANVQRGYGIGGGGFRNIGSQQDVEDRLSQGMASLAQDAETRRGQKQQLVAEMTQNRADLEKEFQNKRSAAIAALYAGDAQAAMQAMQQASQIRQQAIAQEQQMYGQLVGVGGSMMSMGMGGAMQGKGAGGAPTQSASYASQNPTGYGSPYQRVNLPPGY